MPTEPRAELPTGAAKVAAVTSMFDTIAPRYDLMNRLLTFGLDVLWRKRTVRELGLESGSVVADIACGTGDLCVDLGRAGHRPIGFDLSRGMLANARTDTPLVQGDALDLPLANGCVDGVTCGFALRNFESLDPFFAEAARILRPGGRLAVLEVSEPTNPLLGFSHSVYFGRVVPWIGGRLSDADAYRYLPRSIAYLPPIDQLIDDIRAAGFSHTQRFPLTGGVAQLFVATRRDD